MHPRVQWAIAKAQALVLLTRYSDDEPRDESGRWTDGGGSGGGDAKPSDGPSLTAEEHTFLAGSRPTPEKLDQWDDQLTARQIELEKEGKAGNDESMQISHMQSALGAYNQESEESLNSGNVGLNAVYHVSNGKNNTGDIHNNADRNHPALRRHQSQLRPESAAAHHQCLRQQGQ